MLEPENTELRYQLGLAAEELDMNELARDWFAAAVAMNAQHHAARKALRKLTRTEQEQASTTTGEAEKPSLGGD